MTSVGAVSDNPDPHRTILHCFDERTEFIIIERYGVFSGRVAAGILVADGILTIIDVWQGAAANAVMPSQVLCSVNLAHRELHEPNSDGYEVAFFLPLTVEPLADGETRWVHKNTPGQ